MGATNLTGRYWNGSLWYWDDARTAPDIEKCTTACEIDAGVVDLAVIDNPLCFVVGTDAGTLVVETCHDISEFLLLSLCTFWCNLCDNQHELAGQICSLTFFSFPGTVELYPVTVDENNETVLPCGSQMTGHDDSVSSLSLNPTKDMVATGSIDCW